MKILLAFEESQAVTTELRKLGHEAYSCDIQDCSGDHPEWHIKGDALQEMQKPWDMVIAFPPCTHLAVSGARYFEQKRKDGRQQEGIDMFMSSINANAPMVAVENPVGIMSSKYRKPDQIIQPWQFGHDASKKTCLWLKGLPLLVPTDVIIKDRYENQTPSGQNKLGPGPERAKLRSKTYAGIAKAMAQQWGGMSFDK